MKQRWLRDSGRKVAANINITPLIDILLVLLVIFMTITPKTTTGLDTKVPLPQQRPVTQAEEPIIIGVDPQGAVQINHNAVDGDLEGRLQEILKLRRDRTVFVKADKGLFFKTVATVIDKSRAAGASQVGLITGDR
jgi:biopolymer transport protein ExbD